MESQEVMQYQIQLMSVADSGDFVVAQGPGAQGGQDPAKGPSRKRLTACLRVQMNHIQRQILKETGGVTKLGSSGVLCRCNSQTS